jgi:hypothetical protein
MSDEYGFKALISNALSEQAERFRAELATGVSPEREEEILIWFAITRSVFPAGVRRMQPGTTYPSNFFGRVS